jgi:hypothetical protein
MPLCRVPIALLSSHAVSLPKLDALLVPERNLANTQARKPEAHWGFANVTIEDLWNLLKK